MISIIVEMSFCFPLLIAEPYSNIATPGCSLSLRESLFLPDFLFNKSSSDSLLLSRVPSLKTEGKSFLLPHQSMCYFITNFH